MTKKYKISEKGNLVYFNTDSCSTTFCCDHDEWKKYEIMEKLVSAGADEKLVDELASVCWGIGYYEGGLDPDY